MPKIDLCFSGWLRGANVEQALDANGDIVDVSGMDSEELVRKLNASALFVSLASCLGDNDEEEVELFDFEVAD
jgi:hypothetical protein